MVSGSRIIRSTKFTVISSLSYLNCDSAISTRNKPSDSAAAIAGRRRTAQPEKIERAPAKKKNRRRQNAGFGSQQDEKRGQMEHRHQREFCSVAARHRLEQSEAVDQGRGGGQHGCWAAMPGNEYASPQRMTPPS